MSAGRFAGRRALVTGASRRIGAGIAERLAAEGADVVITARTRTEHDHLAGSPEATTARMGAYGTMVGIVVADLVDAVDRQRIVLEAMGLLGGAIEILINDATAAMYPPVAQFAAKRARILFEVGQQGSGTTMYGASKAALNRVTNGLAVELYGTGVRVNTIEPRAAVLTVGAAQLVGSTLLPDSQSPGVSRVATWCRRTISR